MVPASHPHDHQNPPFIPPLHKVIVATLHFMPEAARNVRGITEPDESVLELGADRVRAAMAGIHPGSPQWAGWSAGRRLGGAVLDGEYVEPEGTASFLLAAMICRKASNPKLTGRFAYIEAVYARRVLEGATRPGAGTVSLLSANATTDMYPVCEEVLGARPGSDGRYFTLQAGTYLSLAVGLGRTWKLVNQVVRGGMVYVDRGDLLRLLRDAITAYIRQRVVAMPPPPVQVPPDVAGWCESQVSTAIGGDMPPCAEGCRAVMDRGENLSHPGRFFLANFLIHAGEDDETIAEKFVGAPDFDRRITLSQIRQIRGQGYPVPSCQWVDTNRLCPGCDAPHPTKYKKPEK